MPEQDREQQAQEAQAEDAARQVAHEDEDDEDTPSPFDHPAFLPVLLWALAAWFGYDGFINQDPDMLEHQAFNRYGFAALVVAGAYYTFRAAREMRELRENDPNRS